MFSGYEYYLTMTLCLTVLCFKRNTFRFFFCFCFYNVSDNYVEQSERIIFNVISLWIV